MGKLNVCSYVKKIVLPNLGSTTNYQRLLYKKIDITLV